MKLILSKLATALLELFYPSFPQCPSCGSEFKPQEISLCNKCITKIEFITDDFCQQCGKSIGAKERFCQECRQRRFFFAEARAVGIYEQGLKQYIKQLKYDGYQSLARPLGELLSIYTQQFYDLKEIDLITYIPVHQERMEERGFNQAYLLARELGENTNLPVKSLLARQKNTIKQSKLSRQERLENVQNKFKVEQGHLVKEQKILLVDDIYTTGATVNEASRILLNHSAHSIKVITLATGRGINS